MTDYLRVSDAERREVGELLSRHYLDGRLDADELDERLGQAMRAKTRADLSGLLVDLPVVVHPRPRAVSPAPHRWGPRAAALAIALSLLLPASLMALAQGARDEVWSHQSPPVVLLPKITYPSGRAVRFPGSTAPTALPAPPGSPGGP